MFDQKQGWGKFLGVIQKNPSNDNTVRAIKEMKGEKQLIETIQNSKHKELMVRNENILKFFIYNKLVMQNDKKRQTKRVTMTKRRPMRHNTKDKVLINIPKILKNQIPTVYDIYKCLNPKYNKII